MAIENSSSRNSSTPEEGNGPLDKEISFGIRVLLGVFIITLAVVGIVGNTIVITVLRLSNIFMRKTTSLILTSLAVVDLLGSTVEVPLAFSTMIVAAPVGHLYSLSLAQEVIGPCFFWWYITCFFLLSIDRSDALRKISNRQEFLTTKRIFVVLFLGFVLSIGLALFFTFKTENPNPLLPRQKAPKVLTVMRGSLFLFFVISVSTNIYYYVRVKKLVKVHSEISASESVYQEQRNQWQTKERTISWTIIQVILVICFSYVPYIVASIIYSNVEIHSLDAIASCRSLTYLKYAANAFIFTRLDGKFAMAFYDILRGICSLNNRVCAHPLEQRVCENRAEEEHRDASINGHNRPTSEPNVFAETLRQYAISGNEARVLLIKQYDTNRKMTQNAAKVEFALPVIALTSPTGKTTILKNNSLRRNKQRTSVHERSKTV